MGKWRCHNCDTVFESEDGEEREDFETHIIECFCVEDFFERIKDEQTKG